MVCFPTRSVKRLRDDSDGHCRWRCGQQYDSWRLQAEVADCEHSQSHAAVVAVAAGIGAGFAVAVAAAVAAVEIAAAAAEAESTKR
jgi:hypothetical protein